MPVCSNVTVKALVTLLNVTLLYHNVTVYLIGVSNGPPCLKMKAYLQDLSSRYGFKLIWIPIDLKGSVEPVPKVTKLIEESDLPFQVPVSAVYCGRNLTSIVIGLVEDDLFWSKLLQCNVTGPSVRIYYGEKLVNSVSLQRRSVKSFNLYPFLVSAIVDSLNPVGLAIFSLVNAIYLRLDRKRYWKTVIEFLLAYSIAHVALGSLLAQIKASRIYSIIGAVTASLMIAASIKPWSKLRPIVSAASSKLSKMVLSSASPIVIGALSSTIAMSPCVLGAYLSAVSFLSSLPFPLRFQLTLLYLLIYSIPPLTLAFVSTKLAKKLNTRQMILVLATISLILSLYSLYQGF